MLTRARAHLNAAGSSIRLADDGTAWSHGTTVDQQTAQLGALTRVHMGPLNNFIVIVLSLFVCGERGRTRPERTETESKRETVFVIVLLFEHFIDYNAAIVVGSFLLLLLVQLLLLWLRQLLLLQRHHANKHIHTRTVSY